jgi:hypothetical protein
MSSDTAFEPADFVDRGQFRDRRWSAEPPPECKPLRLTRRAALSVILLLSLGLWAVLWAALASLASAAFG